MNTYKTRFRVVQHGEVILTVEAKNIKEAKALVNTNDLSWRFDEVGIEAAIQWEGCTESPDGIGAYTAIEAIDNMLPEDDFRF